jgi:hypothetical protein
MAGMIQIGVIIGIAIIVAIAIIPFERERRKRLGAYWQRSCTGAEWRNRFPDEPKEAIREFLQVFVDGFAFSSKKRLNFSPNDKVMDVYMALYPSTGWADALELETLAINLEEKYGLDLTKVEYHEITLGQLFEMTRNPNQKMEHIFA